MNWVDAIGYQHEVVHTGMLRWILENDRIRGAAILDALGIRDVIEISEVTTERRLGGRRRGAGKADLVAKLRFSDGSERWLAVETKVDSPARLSQLAATVMSDDELGLLLAVGITGLQYPLDHRPELRTWFAADVSAWHDALREVEAPELATYTQAVEDERDRHARARAAANNGELTPKKSDESDEKGRRVDANLLAWAWLAETREALGESGSPWLAEQKISGPVMWSEGRSNWTLPNEVDVYLSLSVEQAEPRLCIRVGGGPNESMHAVVDHVLERAVAHDYQPARRRLSARNGTYSVAAYAIPDRLPSTAAAAVTAISEKIDGWCDEWTADPVAAAR